jgi:hypothetical protein
MDLSSSRYNLLMSARRASHSSGVGVEAMVDVRTVGGLDPTARKRLEIIYSK